MSIITKAYDIEWRPIPGHPNYIASNMGEIKNIKTGNMIRGNPLWNNGHIIVKVGGGRKACGKLLHRLILKAFVGEPPEGHIGCHKDDDKNNNKLENLYWGTHKQNTADQIRNGKFYFAIGEGNGATVHSDKKIRKIRSEYTGKRGEQSALARKYKISVSHVNNIVRDKIRKTA